MTLIEIPITEYRRRLLSLDAHADSAPMELHVGARSTNQPAASSRS